jgi:hypothetical protein
MPFSILGVPLLMASCGAMSARGTTHAVAKRAVPRWAQLADREPEKPKEDELDTLTHHAISPGPQRSGIRAVSSAGRAAGF